MRDASRTSRTMKMPVNQSIADGAAPGYRLDFQDSIALHRKCSIVREFHSPTAQNCAFALRAPLVLGVLD
jgi:hypothetical protein